MPKTEISPIITPLGQHHVREAFCCGQPRIDTFLTTRALDDHEAYKVRVFVVTDGDNPLVLGFYSLNLTSLVSGTIMGKVKQKFGKWNIPAVYLSMVGVREEFSNRKLGTLLMYDAFERTVNIADNAGTYCLMLDAVNEERALWYERLQFIRTPKDPLQMYIPIPTIKAALAT